MTGSLRRKLLQLLLLLLAVGTSLVTPSPARACNPPPWGECIEYTVFNWSTCQCECPNQECCDFYYPFQPYGC
jgi:hypothetical protein